VKRKCQGSLATEILAYLVRHPAAQDTVEGIAEWWLLEQEIVHAIADVKLALAELESRELVLARTDSFGRTFYRSKRDRIKENKGGK